MMKSAFPYCSLMILLALFLAGCGQAEYEARLLETSAYYNFKNDQAANLGSEWKSSGEITGIKLAPPAGFKQILPPKQEEDEEGNLLPLGDDPRQPNNIGGFYDGELPGIVGCFRKRVNAEMGDSGVDKKVYMYLYVLAQEIGQREPGDFFMDVVQQLTIDMNAEPTSEQDWDEQSYPTTRKYTEQVTYKIATLTAGNPINGLAQNQTDCELYMTSEKGKDVVLVYIYPNSGLNRTAKSELGNGRKFSLQSLRISKSKKKTSSGSKNSSGQSSNNVAF